MEIEKYSNNRELEEQDHVDEAEKKCEIFESAMDAAATTGDVIAALKEYAVVNEFGDNVLVSFSNEGGELEYDVEHPLDPCVAALEAYNRAEIDEQQLYARVFGYPIIPTLVRITGKEYDAESVMKMVHGGHPDFDPNALRAGPEGKIIEGTLAPQELGHRDDLKE